MGTQEERVRIAREEVQKEDPGYQVVGDFLIDFLVERYVVAHPGFPCLVTAFYLDPMEQGWFSEGTVRERARDAVRRFRLTWQRTLRKLERARRRLHG